MPDHQPVMLQETIDALSVQPDGIYVDATFGRGGHSQAILKHLNEQGKLIVIDKDASAIEAAKRLFQQDKRVIIIHDSFASLPAIATQRNMVEQIDGILMDLGVSSPQLDDPTRGFSFMHNGPLDMRMDQTHGHPLFVLLKTIDEKTLSDCLWRDGEEKFSRQIARAIVKAREIAPIETTQALSHLIEKAMPFVSHHKHPATRTFQALRILVNEELTTLSGSLGMIASLLSLHGRLVVISFHSLEDRIVKRFMQAVTRAQPIAKNLPIQSDRLTLPKFSMCIKMKKPSNQEQHHNPRARSAVLRAIERVRE